VGGTAADFGSLSARNIVTGSDGRATVVYTAPVAPSVAVDNFTVVDIVVTPIGGDFNNTTTRSAAIRLVPPGVVIPPDGMRPSFTFTPTAPADHQAVLFDAGASQPQGGIESYDWNFGDGNRGSGRTTSHEYSMAGTYVVTLTITDAYGRSASTSQAISVGAGTNPSAAFVFSPTEPLPGQQVNFNAAASVPAPGRTIVRYRWDFGDGSPSGSGVQASHTYAVAGTYNVTLVVTDDAGRVGTATQSVSVGTGAPTADFTFSPTAPTAATVVNFTAAASTAAPGRTITSYFWSFGDGTTGSGVNVSKLYGVSGSFNVTLTVTDSQGQTATITKTVNVS
jgi:PKD repeat protein